MNEKKEPNEFMSKLVNSETSRFKPPEDTKEDLLKKQAAHMRKKSQPIVAPAGTPQPQQQEFFTIEGHKLPLTRNPFLDAMTTMMYLFSAVLSDNPRVEKILQEAKFNFPDLDGNQIFPKVKKKRKVKIHAKRRKRKSSK